MPRLVFDLARPYRGRLAFILFATLAETIAALASARR